MSELRFFMLRPDTIFAARINELATVTYPRIQFDYDGVTTGAFGDIKPGMTILLGSSAGADDFGRQRIRKAPTSSIIYIGRSSRGFHDGEVNLIDNAYITVLNEYRVWSKTPHISTQEGDGDYIGDMFKDADIEVGTFTDNEEPPVANAGPPALGTINSGTSKLQVMLPHYSPNRSFAVADSTTISSYLWAIPTGVTLAGGSILTDSQITVDCDPGFYWIELTVTDSNGKTHTTRTFVVARDPAGSDDGWISDFEVTSHRVGQTGQTLSVKVLEDINRTDSPDGTIVALIEGELSSLTQRNNLMFWGWHEENPESIQAKRTGTITHSIFDCTDVAGRLDKLVGFSQVLYRDSKRLTAANPEITWAYMANPTWDKLLHYLLYWHSSALELTDWQDTGTGDIYQFVVREAGGASIFDQVNRQANSLVPAYVFTCDRLGRLNVRPDPILQPVADRTAAVQDTIPVADWASIEYTYLRPPRVHWLDDAAIQAGTDETALLFCHAPGDSPGQGEGMNIQGEQIAVDQESFNESSGHRYARLNSRDSHFQIQLTEMGNNNIDPALMEWVTLSIPGFVAAERGLSFFDERGLVHEMTFNYQHNRTGIIRTVDILWEREVIGSPAVTIIPPVVPDLEITPFPTIPFTPPDLDDDAFTGLPQAYAMWNLHRVFRTWDILASSPTWEFIDSGLQDGSREIYDLQYIVTTTTAVGCYAMTSDGVYYSANILAPTPTWVTVLTNATIQATENQPTVGNTIAISMATWGVEPTFIVVATGYDVTAEASSSNNNDKIAYMWHSHDNGTTWTTIDISAETRVYLGDERSYSLVDLYSCSMYRDADAKIYCARGVQVIGLNEHTKVFVSSDQGHTWGVTADFWEHFNLPERMATHHPYPDITSPCWIVVGNIGATGRPKLYQSTDEFENNAIIFEADTPAGYGGVAPSFRPNTDPFDANHIIIWARDKSGSPFEYDLMKSANGGSSWSAIWEPDINESNVQMPVGVVSTSPYSTPNGWPADSNTWFTIRLQTDGGLTAGRIIHTDNEFSTTADKEGNLNTLLSGNNWDEAQGGGFVLPKIGVNA